MLVITRIFWSVSIAETVSVKSQKRPLPIVGHYENILVSQHSRDSECKITEGPLPIVGHYKNILVSQHSRDSECKITEKTLTHCWSLREYSGHSA